MIRDPYEAPTMRMRACSRRAFLTRRESEPAIALEGLDDETLASLTRYRELRGLRLSTCEIGPVTVAALRSLTSLRELWLWRCKVTAPGLEDAIASLSLRSLYLDRPGAHGLAVSSLVPRCEGLESLSLDFAGETDTPFLDALAALPTLRWLRLLYASQLTDETLPRLASLSALEGLTLHGCEAVKGESLDSLATIQNLRALKLVSSELTEASYARFASLRSLRSIDLAVCKNLSIAPLLPMQSLEVLRLMSSNPSGKQIEAIGDFANLTHLELNSCSELTDKRLRELGERLTLRGLGIASTSVRGASFEDAERWSQLEDLDAGFTKLDDATMASLAKLPKLRRVEMVYCNEVTAKGLAHITDFAALDELNVQGVNAVNDAVVSDWARRPRWDELTVYACTKVTGRSVVPLMRAHPEVMIVSESHRLCDRSLAASEGYDERVKSLELAEGSLAALVTPTAVMLIDRPSGKRRNKKSIAAKDAIVRLDPKGRALVTVAKKTRVWDATNGDELPSLAFKLARIDDAAFSADGSRFAIAGLGGTKKKPQRLVYLWEVSTWTQLGTLEATHCEAPTRVALSPDGSHVVVAHSSIEVLSVKSAERVLHIAKSETFACFDAKGDAVLYLDGGSVMRAPLDGAAVTTVTSWQKQLERAGGATVMSERAELAANPDYNVERREFTPYALMLRGGEPVVLAYGGGYPGATGLVVGERAMWIQCDVYGDRAIAISRDAKTLMVGYPQERANRLEGRSGVWPLDEVMTMASEG